MCVGLMRFSALGVRVPGLGFQKQSPTWHGFKVYGRLLMQLVLAGLSQVGVHRGARSLVQRDLDFRSNEPKWQP